MDSPIYWDALHGTIDFQRYEFRNLINDLISTPEMQRLRHVRLMNFDVPSIQDLATVSRFPHSIGTCFIATEILRNSPTVTRDQQRNLVAAALVHDVGIPPYGHLIETVLRKYDRRFSHESLAFDLFYGRSDPLNIYHQIFDNRSLAIAKVLRSYSVDAAGVLDLISPRGGSDSAVSADIDIDNIDNVHRMATLLGFTDAKRNALELIRSASIDDHLKLVFSHDSLPAIERWRHLRRSIYEDVLGNPTCVAYNAFLTDMIEAAVSEKLISTSNWSLTDNKFQERLSEHDITRPYADQLASGCRYQLIDYVWLHGTGDLPTPDWRTVGELLKHQLGAPPIDSARYFIWPESRIISREVELRLSKRRRLRLGDNSYSLIIALVLPHDGRRSSLKSYPRERSSWRRKVHLQCQDNWPHWTPRRSYPENYRSSARSLESEGTQLDFL